MDTTVIVSEEVRKQTKALVKLGICSLWKLDSGPEESSELVTGCQLVGGTPEVTNSAANGNKGFL